MFSTNILSKRNKIILNDIKFNVYHRLPGIINDSFTHTKRKKLLCLKHFLSNNGYASLGDSPSLRCQRVGTGLVHRERMLGSMQLTSLTAFWMHYGEGFSMESPWPSVGHGVNAQ